MRRIYVSRLAVLGAGLWNTNVPPGLWMTALGTMALIRFKADALERMFYEDFSCELFAADRIGVFPCEITASGRNGKGHFV